jgi:hypothetical protein
MDSARNLPGGTDQVFLDLEASKGQSIEGTDEQCVGKKIL